jgi:transcriptional regulator GlxA family with amidase domain
VQVFGFDLDEEASRFKDWFTTWLTNPFTQSEGFQQHLSHQIYEVVYTTIARIGENIEEAARGHRLKSGRRPIKELLDLADYFYHNTEEQLTTAEMTAISGINRRNLFYNFKHHTGFTPHQLFKYIRLQAVRRDLMNAAGNVTELAMKHNFHHLGEFSRLYKSTYGELPSRTLNKL